MKSRLLASALLIGLSTSGSASAEYSRDPTNSLHSGAVSIQFLTFGGGYRPAFRTSGLYLKWHLSDRSALRIGTDLSLDESSGKNPRPTDTSQLISVRNYSNQRNYTVSVSSEYQRYVDATGPVTIYLGLGPYWSRSRYYYDYSYNIDTYPYPYTQTYQSDERSWEVGGSVAMGFEWFFKRKLSLLGRVGANVGFGERHTNRRSQSVGGGENQIDVERFDATTAGAGTSGAAIGAAVYF